MADKKREYVTVVLPTAVAAHCYLDKPDDKAPDNAKFKADGKYKVTVVYDDMEPLKELEAAVRKKAASEFEGEIDWDNFAWPWREWDEDASRESFRGKVTVTAKTKNKPVIKGAGGVVIPASVRVFGGDKIKIAVTLYCYEKTEKVKEGKKMIDVMTRGCSPQLYQVKLMEKRSGGGADPFGDDDEGGYEVTAEAQAGGAASTSDDADF